MLDFQLFKQKNMKQKNRCFLLISFVLFFKEKRKKREREEKKQVHTSS